MKNQFFYSYTSNDNQQLTGSFNLDMVVRTLSMEAGRSVVFLNDYYEAYSPITVPDAKGKPKMEMRKQHMHSQIELNAEDTIRFREVTEMKQWSKEDFEKACSQLGSQGTIILNKLEQ
jgi:hypothetical protein